MVVANSDSTGTLVSLGNNVKIHEHDLQRVETATSYRKTEIALPADDCDDFDEDDEDFGFNYCVKSPQQCLYLPSTEPVDHYLRNLPEVVESCDELLSYQPMNFDLSSKEKVLYVGQGEVAHAVSQQCDVLASDKATTCHILAVRSTSGAGTPLASLTHIDAPSYDQCIREMVREHKLHHLGEVKTGEYSYMGCEQIEMDLHILGGFEDDESSSRAISNWLMHLLATIADEEVEHIKFTLKTCAISSLNDNGRACPIGRGLAMNLHSGVVYLASVTNKCVGPRNTLRSVRLWSNRSKLSLIHSQKSDLLQIEPFEYSCIPQIPVLLSLSDMQLLKCCSTSPDVEEGGFCESVRSSFCLMRDVPCTVVFGDQCDRTLQYQRSGRNSWTAVS